MNPLTSAIVAGEPEAWAVIDAHAERLRGMAVGYSIDPEDALQEMRIKLWRAATHGTTFDSTGHLVQYGVSAMRSVAHDAYRHSQFPSKKHTPVPLDDVDWRDITTPDAADIVDHFEWRRRFWEVLEPYLNGPRERIAIGTLAAQHKNNSSSSNSIGTHAFKPAQVAMQWPHLFENEQDVYNVRRGVLGRIRRNPTTMNTLRELREEAA